MHRRLTALLAALIACVALATCGVVGPLADGHVDIEQADLQARIAPRFPAQQCKLLVACLELSNPVILLTEGDDHIGLQLDARVSLGTRERAGRIAFTGHPRYVPAEGQLFLDDVQITTLEFAGLPEDYATLIKRQGPALIRNQLQARPIYTLNANTTQGALAKRVVREVQVVNGKLRVSWAPDGAR